MSDRAYIGWARWLSWTVLGWLYRPLAWVVFRPAVTGLECLPAGGYLLLANHTSTVDTVWVAAPTGRVVHFMTSAAMFRNPLAGRLLRWFNCFPKEVGSRDAGATDTTFALLEAGQVVQIMPEGTRTWDGRLQPIRPGIAKLALKAGLPVVLCRTETGHLIWPRWATWPRWVPLVMAYERVDPEGSVDAMLAKIQQGLAPTGVPTPGARGFRLAEGLALYLWACPACFARATHGVGDTFSCRDCGASWTVTVDMVLDGPDPLLRPASGASRPTPGGLDDRETNRLTIADAADRIREHFGSPPVLAEDCIHCAQVEIRPLKGGTAYSGPITLTETGLVGEDWSLSFEALRRVYMDAGNILILRTQEGSLELVPRQESTWMWFQLLDPRCGSGPAKNQIGP